MGPGQDPAPSPPFGPGPEPPPFPYYLCAPGVFTYRPLSLLVCSMLAGRRVGGGRAGGRQAAGWTRRSMLDDRDPTEAPSERILTIIMVNKLDIVSKRFIEVSELQSQVRTTFSGILKTLVWSK